MRLKYRSQDYEARLNHSMFRINGVAAYVRTSGDEIQYTTNVNGAYQLLNNLEDLDVSSVPLGYVNTRNGVYYVSRCPHRSYKQGVTNRNIKVRPLPKHENHNNIEVFSTPFFKMVNGDYPPLNSILKKSGVFQMAISRDIAISQNELEVRNVYYKNSLVGWMAPKSNKVIVPSTEKAQIVSMYLQDFDWEIE